jgi:hypothetical protein
MDAQALTQEQINWIEAAFSNAAIQPCCKQETMNRAVSKRLLTPRSIQVSLADFRAPFVGLPEGIYSVWLLLEDDPQSVFYDPATKKFGACWGPDVHTGEIIDLGFRSEDPIEMYIA